MQAGGVHYPPPPGNPCKEQHFGMALPDNQSQGPPTRWCLHKWHPGSLTERDSVHQLSVNPAELPGNDARQRPRLSFKVRKIKDAGFGTLANREEHPRLRSVVVANRTPIALERLF